jgi:hypothetical protein
MPPIAYYFLLTALLCLPPQLQAGTVHRCEAPNGQITFTTLSCTAEERLSLQAVHTFTPGSTMALMPNADTGETSSLKNKRRAPTIVGQAEGKCGNLINTKERRTAIINKRIVAGMSEQDVESALGKPDKISIRNSSTSYRYDTRRGRSAYVEFDEKGCTKGKAKLQTAKSPR